MRLGVTKHSLIQHRRRRGPRCLIRRADFSNVGQTLFAQSGADGARITLVEALTHAHGVSTTHSTRRASRQHGANHTPTPTHPDSLCMVSHWLS